LALLLSTSPLAHSAPPSDEIPGLLAALREGPEGRRNRAAQRLYHLQDPRGNSAVIALAGANEPALKAIGLRALAIVKPPGATRLVRSALHSGKLPVLLAAIDAAGMLALADTARRLRQLLRHANPICRSSALRALGRLGRAGLSGVRQALRSPDLEQRLAAVTILGSINGKGARSLLRRTARRAGPRESLVAARALLAHNDIYGYRTVSRLLRQSDKEIRLQAISLLVEHRQDPAARRLLQRSARHADPDVSRLAADALASVERPK